MQYRRLISQLSYFFIAGSFAVSADYIIYIITLESLGIFFSKIIGFYSGVFVSYLINSYFTFSKKGKNFISSKYFLKYLIILTISMLINVTTNYFILYCFSFLTKINLIAFLIATIISMVFNFINLKLIVFK